MTDRTCMDRVGPAWESRREDLEHMLFAHRFTREELENHEVDPDDPTGTFCEYGLDFSYVPPGTFSDQEQGWFNYQISTGGPGEEIRFFVDMDGNLYKAEFWFLDWFDGAHKLVTNDEVARAVFEFFKDCDMIRINR